MNSNFSSNRRCFLTGAALTAGMYGLNLAAQSAETKTEKDSGIYVIGPKPGYTPQVGTLVSMLTYIQTAVTSSVKGLTMADLDYLFDANANTIGALLLHLAATETYYGMNTFENKKWDSWSDDLKKKWDFATLAMPVAKPSRATTSTTTSTSSTRPANTPSPNFANEMTSGSYQPIQSNLAAVTR